MQCRALGQSSRYLIHDKETLKSYNCLLSKPVLSKPSAASLLHVSKKTPGYAIIVNSEDTAMLYNWALETSRNEAQVFCYIHGYPATDVEFRT